MNERDDRRVPVEPRETLARSDGVYLTPPQREAHSTFMTSLQDTTRGPRIIVLEGFTGMGKTRLLRHMQDQIAERGAAVVEGARVRFDAREIDATHKGTVIVDAVPYETNEAVARIQTAHPELRDVERIILRGMTAEETEAYLRKMDAGNSTRLAVDDIVHFSMGVPLLVSRLSTQGLTRQDAFAISRNYLLVSMAPMWRDEQSLSDIENYLRMEPPDFT